MIYQSSAVSPQDFVNVIKAGIDGAFELSLSIGAFFAH
jgi:hypothetical protein